MVVELPPNLIRFSDINDDEEEYTPSPSHSPPRPTPHKRVKSKSDSNIRNLEIFTRSCERCQRGKRDCVVDEVGGACGGCKARKYGCDHTGQTNVKTIWVTRPVSDSGSEVEVLEDRKGKKRRAESPVPAKKKVSVKVEKVEKMKEKVQKTREKGERPKVKVERTKAKVERPKASGSKPTARRRAAPKSSAVVDVTSGEDDEGAMVVDDDESEDEPKPKPKRARLAKGKSQ
jgi:hypothetical protein